MHLSSPSVKLTKDNSQGNSLGVFYSTCCLWHPRAVAAKAASEWGHMRHEVPKALRTSCTSVLQALICLLQLPRFFLGSFFIRRAAFVIPERLPIYRRASGDILRTKCRRRFARRAPQFSPHTFKKKTRQEGIRSSLAGNYFSQKVRVGLVFFRILFNHPYTRKVGVNYDFSGRLQSIFSLFGRFG